ncbi:hypothetical protein GCM10023144_01630 [Pigmentiphaga soli]|uniref:Uncharacterized protein n=1 Tax=Pigmentiphaga soli TaxID=1007095 RepID=A0ABP8GCU1_9BURK
MQAFNLDHQPAQLVGIKLREELKDERGLPDVYLSFLCRMSAAALAMISPELRTFLYKSGAQQDIDGSDDGDSLRFPELGKQHVSKKVTGAHFTLHYGVGESNGVSTEPVSEDTQIDKFTLDPQEGGTVLVGFRVWGKFTGPQIGSLALTLGHETAISTHCPEPAQGQLLDESGQPKKRARKGKTKAEADAQWPFPQNGAAPADPSDPPPVDDDPFAGSDLARGADGEADEALEPA